MILQRMRMTALTALLLLAASAAAAAGDLRIGLRGGLSIPNIQGSDTDIFTRGFTSRRGPSFGVFVERALAADWSLVLEFNYTSQGGKRNGMQVITEVPPGLPTDLYLFADFNNETILDYLELPVLARLSFGRGRRFFLNAGPYAGYLVRARAVTGGSSLIYLDESGTQPVVPSPVSFDADTDVLDSLKRWNLGLTGGAGLSMPAGHGEIIIEGRFQLGLAVLQKDVATSGKSRTGAFVVALGYCFSRAR